MTGIILKYRCPRRPGEVKGEPPLGPQLDAQRAVSLVRSRAAEWGIDPKRIGMVGFSAGGHLALATATGFAKRLYEPIDAVDEVSCRPDFAVLCYSGYLKAKDKDEIRPGLRIPADTPPIFLAHASDDKESYGGSDLGEQRVHVPGLEARRHPDRAAHLRHRRPRLRRPAEREAPLELDAALRQLAYRAKALFVSSGRLDLEVVKKLGLEGEKIDAQAFESEWPDPRLRLPLQASRR